eukprot:GHVT01006170.1.p1 GENE.GHVT01006170.1~~GHVT01006170.1.p1  ORF type:complete len:115 (+),score=28.48 GHVT01006170.1:313-657(+)
MIDTEAVKPAMLPGRRGAADVPPLRHVAHTPQRVLRKGRQHAHSTRVAHTHAEILGTVGAAAASVAAAAAGRTARMTGVCPFGRLRLTGGLLSGKFAAIVVAAAKGRTAPKVFI